MIQRDYILRLIEEMGKFLNHLFKLQKRGLIHKSFDEFEAFIKTHFGRSIDDLMAKGEEIIPEKLKEPMEKYPDELGQLLFSGSQIAIEIDERAKGQFLMQLAWEAYIRAEKNSKTFRFNRAVEMNAIRDQLALMGVVVEVDGILRHFDRLSGIQAQEPNGEQ